MGIFVFIATATLIILAVDRNTDLRYAFQRNITGFHSGEAATHAGAVGALNAMQKFALPTPLIITGAQGVFGGLNALLYMYTLQSGATNNLGVKELTINNQFQAHLIPIFQSAAFHSGDMEVLPGPTAIINGRLHADGDLSLNHDTCGSAANNGVNIRPWCRPSGRGSAPQHTLKGDEGPLPFPYGAPYSAPAFTLSATDSIDRARHAADLLRMIPKQGLEVLDTEQSSWTIPLSAETAQSVRQVRGREIPAAPAREVVLKLIWAEDVPGVIRR